MQQPDGKLREHGAANLFVHAHGGAQVGARRLLDDRIDDVSLLALAGFGANELKHPAALVLIEDECLNGHATRWHFFNDREIKVAVDGQSQRARDGCRRHHQNVGGEPLADQLLALQDAETVLLVHNDQAEARELHVLFNQGMRPDHQAATSLRDSPLYVGFHRPPPRADQKVHINRQIFEQVFDIEVVLRGENFRRRHERDLETVVERDKRSLDSHDGFSRAHIALEETVHRLGHAHIVHDFLQHTLLRRGGMKRQDALDRFARAVRHAEGDTGRAFPLPVLEREARGDVEELLEDQPHLGRAAK